MSFSCKASSLPFSTSLCMKMLGVWIFGLPQVNRAIEPLVPEEFPWLGIGVVLSVYSLD